MAYFLVKSLALLRAEVSLVFQCSAASLLWGSSGLGEARRLWMESSTERIWRAGDQFFLRMSRQMRPRLSG